MILRVASLIGTARPEADAGDGGVDADDAPEAVGQRAAGVARVERRVGLDHVLDQPTGRARAGRQRAPERRDDARGDRAGEAHRAADRDHELADAERVRVPELGGSEVARLGADDGEVGERVLADDLGAQLAAVGEGRPHSVVARGDDVRRGEHEAVRA